MINPEDSRKGRKDRKGISVFSIPLRPSRPPREIAFFTISIIGFILDPMMRVLHRLVSREEGKI